MKSMLGMYVHMHWGYGHPYAARTWSLEDWRSYAGGLAELGYTGIMLWPMVETMPDPLTPSDVAHLEKIQRVIDLLHDEFGMQVIVTMGLNVLGNAHAAEYTFEDRPYFKTDVRLNPLDRQAIDRLFDFHRRVMQYLARADGLATIDSDPGGYIGSKNTEFVALLTRQLAMQHAINPDMPLFYWMWVGWESYNRFWQESEAKGEPVEIVFSPEDWEESVRGLLAQGDDGWGLFSCNNPQQTIVERFNLQERTLCNPYGLIEAEPSFPLTNYTPESIAQGLEFYQPDRMRLGVMANAQSHILQLPNTYFFAHLAQGGTLENLDIVGFAEGLMPGWGTVLAEAWQALGSNDTTRMRQAEGDLDRHDQPATLDGRYAGLLFGDPQRYLADVRLQLRFRADAGDFAHAVAKGQPWAAALQALHDSWGAWVRQTGFVDAYIGPVYDLLHPALRALHDPGITAVLNDFDNWRDPAVRNGIVPRLLHAMQQVARMGTL
jgi:hypothetical protein